MPASLAYLRSGRSLIGDVQTHAPAPCRERIGMRWARWLAQLDSADLFTRAPSVAPRGDRIEMTKARTSEPVRNQSEMVFEVPDDAIGAQHPARVLWQALGKLDISSFLDGVLAIEGGSVQRRSSRHDGPRAPGESRCLEASGPSIDH